MRSHRSAPATNRDVRPRNRRLAAVFAPLVAAALLVVPSALPARADAGLFPQFVKTLGGPLHAEMYPGGVETSAIDDTIVVRRHREQPDRQVRPERQPDLADRAVGFRGRPVRQPPRRRGGFGRQRPGDGHAELAHRQARQERQLARHVRRLEHLAPDQLPGRWQRVQQHPLHRRHRPEACPRGEDHRLVGRARGRAEQRQRDQHVPELLRHPRRRRRQRRQHLRRRILVQPDRQGDPLRRLHVLGFDGDR